MVKKTKEIDALEERISSFKKKTRLEQRQILDQEKNYSRAGAGFQISTELIASVLLGASIGYFLDGLLNTKPWFLVLFTIFGGAAGVLNIYRTFKVKSLDKRSK